MINFLVGFFTCAIIVCALFVYVKVADAEAKKRDYKTEEYINQG